MAESSVRKLASKSIQKVEYNLQLFDHWLFTPVLIAI